MEVRKEEIDGIKRKDNQLQSWGAFTGRIQADYSFETDDNVNLG